MGLVYLAQDDLITDIVGLIQLLGPWGFSISNRGDRRPSPYPLDIFGFEDIIKKLGSKEFIVHLFCVPVEDHDTITKALVTTLKLRLGSFMGVQRVSMNPRVLSGVPKPPRNGGDVDGARKELTSHMEKEVSAKEPSSNNEIKGVFGRSSDIRETERIPPGSSYTGNLVETNSSPKDIENPKMTKNRKGASSDRFVLAEERKCLLAMRRKPEDELQTQEIAESQVVLNTTLEPESSMNKGRISAESNREKVDTENGHQQVGMANHGWSSVLGINKQLKPDITNWTGISSDTEASKETLAASAVQHEPVLERKDNTLHHCLNHGDSDVQANQLADSYPSAFSLKEQMKTIFGKDVEHHIVLPAKDVNVLMKHVSQEEVNGSSDGFKMVPYDGTLKYGNQVTVLEKSIQQKEDNKSVSTDLPPSPEYTTLEKWIMDRQKRKLIEEENWALKQRKTGKKIAACFDKLKKNVSSSEDISAKTKSVIELKKLQLLQLQRRLRSDFLNDFFKPIVHDMERLKSIKKHRHGRRMKQLEKFEQKMKEERQKRIRERQKEFFSEIEVHKRAKCIDGKAAYSVPWLVPRLLLHVITCLITYRERLDDWFKIKRERSKGFNKYVKEFHKRKERIHREKIDRIQREKINLLKINDVEGYLRMVQDAKSDRVKQLLKETEKYLQKLGSKLQEAKAVASRFETEMDENQAANVVEKNEHYLESNEKYYLMAHSIKESIVEQPASLQGGKLREYQMNGLRWLVSLYNNHLNGILADEMGLGKTVQVIALICYLMEAKNDRGPFLVVVPSSVLPGWDSEISFWAPGINKISYAGPPEERRRERILQQKFNVLLTTYEYLMNKHDRPKLSKIHWHYIIIDEGHRIKNASCKLNADLKHYNSSHRLLLTGTPLQNNLEELWALLNFLLPNIFNSSEDFSQWFNKPFESSGDSSPDQALLSEEENLLIINRLHQVLRPFVLRRLKQKVENQLPEKIERLIRCEASSYQKLLMKRVEDNLGAMGNSKGRSVHNSVMELRNICNHPYLSQLHAEEACLLTVDSLIPKHYLPPIVRLCGKLEILDRILPKLKETDHRVLFFSTMTRLLDVMEEYLHWKRYRYLRLDGQTSGGDRGALIDEFNRPDSSAFIFLLSIRAGGVGVNLQAADTVIIFDTDWNPQVDLQAQARAHRIGQKRDVLVLRLETVRTVEEQVRAAAEHKLGVANQSITAGFFDNNTSAEDRREYLESLLRECKKEEAAPVLDDDSLNDLLARSESEIDIFESIDKQRRKEEMAAWQKLVQGQDKDCSLPLPSMPSRLVTDDDLNAFCKAMQIYEVSNVGAAKRKSEYLGGLDTQQYGRGKRAREVRSYEDKWTEEEFEKLCQADSPGSPKSKEGPNNMGMATDASESTVAAGTAAAIESPILLPSPGKELIPPSRRGRGRPNNMGMAIDASESRVAAGSTEQPCPPQPAAAAIEPPTLLPPPGKQLTPPSRRGRGRPKRATSDISPSTLVLPAPSEAVSKLDVGLQRETIVTSTTSSEPDFPGSITVKGLSGATQHEFRVGTAPGSLSTNPGPSVPRVGTAPGSLSTNPGPSIPMQVKQFRKTQSGVETPRRRGKKQGSGSPAVGPEINAVSRMPKERVMALDSSSTSFAQDKQNVVNRPSGTSNAPFIAGPEINPISGIPKEIGMTSYGSPNPAFTQDRQKAVNRSSGTSNAPTIVSFEVNPISGLPKMVELVPVRGTVPSFQEKYKSVVPGLDKKEIVRGLPVSEAKAALSQNTSTAGTNHISALESEKIDGVKTSVLHAGKEQKVDQSSTPVMSALAQNLIERRSLRAGSTDVMPDNKQTLAKSPESASVQSVQKAGSGLDASGAEPSSSSRDAKATCLALPGIKSDEFATCQDNVILSNAPGMSSQGMKNEKPLVSAPLHRRKSFAEENKSKLSSTVKRGPKKKDVRVPNYKQAAFAMKSSNTIETRAPISHAYLVSSGDRTTTKATITRDKRETDAKNLRNVTSDKSFDSHPPEIISDQKPNSTEKSDLSAQSKQQLDASRLPRNAVASLESTSVCIDVNEVQSLQSKDEGMPKVRLSQTPAVLDSSTDQTQASGTQNVSPVMKSCLSEIKNGGSLESKTTITKDKLETDAQELTNVTSRQASNVCPPDMFAGQEPNSTKKSEDSSEDKKPSDSSMVHEYAASFMDKNSAYIQVNEVYAHLKSKNEAFPSELGLSQTLMDPAPSSGRTQAVDIGDVASVMKEVCPSETKNGEPMGSKDGGAPTGPVTSKTFTDEGTKSHFSEHKMLASSSLETVSLVSNRPVEKYDNRSAKDEDPVLVNAHESKPKDASLLIGGEVASTTHSSTLILEVKAKSKVCKPENELTSGSAENLTDSRQLCEGESCTVGSMEFICSVPVSTCPKDDVTCEKPIAIDGAPGSCSGASIIQRDTHLESRGAEESPLMTENNAGNNVGCVLRESAQSAHHEVNNMSCSKSATEYLRLDESSCPNDQIAGAMSTSEAAIGHSTEACCTGLAENQYALEMKPALHVVLEDLDKPVNRHVEVEGSMTPEFCSVAASDLSESADILSHKNSSESGHDTSVSEVAKYALEETNNGSAVKAVTEAGSVAGICTFVNSEKHDGSSARGHSKILDLPTAAPTVSASVQLLQPDKLIVYTKCALDETNKGFAVKEVTQDGSASGICTSMNFEKQDGSTAGGHSEVLDLPTAAATMSASGQLLQLDELIVDAFSATHCAADDSAGPLNRENADDYKKLEGTVLHGQSEVPDLLNITPFVPACDQVSQPDQQTLDLPSPHGADDDTTGSMNPETQGKADDSKKHESTTVLGQRKVPNLPNTASIVSASGQLLQPDERIVSASKSHCASVVSVGPMNQENADDCGKIEGITVLDQGEVSDLPNIAPSIPACGQVPQPDEQIPDPSASVHGADIDSLSSMHPENPGKADGSKKHESTTVLGRSEVPDLSNTPSTVSVSDQLMQQDERIVDASGTHCAADDSVDPMNQEITDDYKKLEGTHVVVQSEDLDLPNIAPSLPASGQVPQPDELILDPHCLQGAGADFVGSVNPENPGKLDDFKKHDNTTVLGPSEIPDVPNTASSVSATSQISQPDELIPHLSRTDGAVDSEGSMNSGAADLKETDGTIIPRIDSAVDDSVGSVNCEKLGTADCMEPDSTTIPCQIEAPDQPDATPTISAFAQAQSDLQIPNPFSTHCAGDDNEGSTNQEKANNFAAVCESTGPSHIKNEDHPGIVTLNEVSSDENKLDGHTSKVTDIGIEVILPKGPLISTRTDDVGDIPCIAPPDPAFIHSIVALHGFPSDKDKLDGHTSEDADIIKYSNDGGGPVFPAKADDSGYHHGISLIGPASGQDAQCEDQNLEAPCGGSEDKELLVLEAVHSVAAEVCSMGPVPVGHCEIQLQAVDESNEDNCNVTCSISSEIQASPQQVLADLSEDHEAALPNETKVEKALQ
ncbi:hypothetical protein HHK36_012504 [Tetracentron sinense]|uniref:Uncharacterized protein n=1 Tax=Tetracentron sinense TaxID=13715 RepID=A0A834Z8H4_TETSI|nr:hypothetical protein HHK36_012504 [Tetracentron sinense]